jgi:hypothetical protein
VQGPSYCGPFFMHSFIRSFVRSFVQESDYFDICQCCHSAHLNYMGIAQKEVLLLKSCIKLHNSLLLLLSTLYEISTAERAREMKII